MLRDRLVPVQTRLLVRLGFSHSAQRRGASAQGPAPWPGVDTSLECRAGQCVLQTAGQMPMGKEWRGSAGTQDHSLCVQPAPTFTRPERGEEMELGD